MKAGIYNMENERIPKPGEIYCHFKNKLYQIITIAINSETREKMVVYQALYGDFKIYVRPLAMFISEVDHIKYPEVQQKFRFELQTLNEDINEEEVYAQEEIPMQIEVPIQIEVQDSKIIEVTDVKVSNENVPNENVEGEVNPILMKFLDANSYEEKLSILGYNKNQIDDKLIDAMAASLDCTVEEGDIEERMRGLMFCLQTMVRFESNRLR